MRKKLNYNDVIPAKAGIQHATNYLKRPDFPIKFKSGNDVFCLIVVSGLHKSFSTKKRMRENF